MAVTRELSECVDGSTITYNPATEKISASLQRSTDTPSMISSAAGSAGSSGEASDADHTHQVITGTPVGLTPGASNDAGSSNALAKANHVHALPSFGSTAGTFMEGNATPTAGALKTTGADVDVSAASPPTQYQVPTATDATHATWQTPIFNQGNTIGTATTGGSHPRGDGTRVDVVLDMPIVSTGRNQYFSNTSITSTGTNNDIPIYQLRNGANNPASEATISLSATSSTTARAAFVWSSSESYLDVWFKQEVWGANLFASVDTYTASDDPTIIAQAYAVVESSGGDSGGSGTLISQTVTVTGSGTSRTATFSSSGIDTNRLTASATNTLAGYLQTPSGIYQITAKTGGTSCTITVPSGYSNESAVTFFTWSPAGSLMTTPRITATAAPILHSTKAQTAEFLPVVSGSTMLPSSRLGVMLFTHSATSKTLSLAVNGERGSFLSPAPSESDNPTRYAFTTGNLTSYTPGNLLKVDSYVDNRLIIKDAGFNITDAAANFAWSANAATVDVSVNHNFAATNTLTGNSTLTLSNGVDGCNGMILVKQDGTGGRTLSFTISGRTVLKDVGVSDTNPLATANSITMYQYFYVTVASTAYVVLNKVYLA